MEFINVNSYLKEMNEYLNLISLFFRESSRWGFSFLLREELFVFEEILIAGTIESKL